MEQEIEAKFLGVNIEDMRAQLKSAGGHLEKPMRLMRRHQFDFKDRRFRTSHNERLRVRDEGDKITVTYKSKVPGSNYDQEIETTVGSYDAMKELFLALGLEAFAYQETKRETWRLDDVEVVIDEWPWAKPYIEIEGSNEASVQAVAQKLGFKWEQAVFGSANNVYRAQYPKMTKQHDIGAVADLRFEGEIPEYIKNLL
ncbi:MAG TPA: class IV adenylate cyclase [Candidatus Saccharimonadales bacterium]